MKIGEVAKRIGVSVSTLRMYEQRGLIEAGRSEGGTRHYAEEDVARFGAVVALTRADVSIDSIVELALVRPSHTSGDSASRKVGALLSALEAEMEDRLKRLRAVRSDLHKAQQKLAGCHGCHKRPTRKSCDGCSVAEDLLECSVMSIVWDQEPTYG